MYTYNIVALIEQYNWPLNNLHFNCSHATSTWAYGTCVWNRKWSQSHLTKEKFTNDSLHTSSICSMCSYLYRSLLPLAYLHAFTIIIVPPNICWAIAGSSTKSNLTKYMQIKVHKTYNDKPISDYWVNLRIISEENTRLHKRNTISANPQHYEILY